MKVIAAALAALLVASACYLIVEPPPPPPQPIPVPHYVEVPVPTPMPTPVPVPSLPGPPMLKHGGLVVLWFVRLDLTAGALAPQYEKLVDTLQAELIAAGMSPRAEAVLSQYDRRVIWSRSALIPAPVPLRRALAFHALREPSYTDPCPTRSIAQAGWGLTSMSAHYPDELFATDENPDGKPPPSMPVDGFVKVLNDGPDFPSAVLVMVIDSGPRPVHLDDAQCLRNGDPPSAWFGGHTPVRWLNSSGDSILKEQTRFGFIATAEGVDADTSLEQCLRSPDFPQSALDLIATSPNLVFDPLNADLQPISSRWDYCEVLGGQWEARGFVLGFRDTLLQLRPGAPRP